MLTPDRMQLLMEMSISCVLEPAQEDIGLCTVLARRIRISVCVRQAAVASAPYAFAAGVSPSSTAGIARYRAKGLSAEPPARMIACTLLLMSSTVMTPTLLVVLDSPLHPWDEGILVPMLREVDQAFTSRA